MRGERHRRIKREDKTIEAMIRLYCREVHEQKNGLCPPCRELLSYSRQRLDRCPFGDGKLTCAKCSIHCYGPAKRESIREVMRYAGPRMMFFHPVLALLHLFDRRRDEPVLERKNRRR